jgi:hypothetical protein
MAMAAVSCKVFKPTTRCHRQLNISASHFTFNRPQQLFSSIIAQKRDGSLMFPRLLSSNAKSGDEYDYVVVGAGSAGCTIANRLVLSDNQASLLVTEAGPAADQSWRVRMPSGMMYCLRNKRIDWCYETTPQVCLLISLLRFYLLHNAL